METIILQGYINRGCTGSLLEIPMVLAHAAAFLLL